MAKDRAPAATAPGDPARSMPPRGKPPFLGWRMVAVAFFVDFIAVGFFFYSYGVFFKALATEFGGARLDVSLGLTLVNAVGAVLAPFLGQALDRYPIKYVIAAGTAAMSLGFCLLSLVTARWQFYLILSTLIGFGLNAMGGLATAKLVANWFDRGRGMALGVATMGISLSGVLMPVLSALLVEAGRVARGFLVFGAFTALLVLPVTLRFVISSPEHLGLAPDGDRPSPIPAVTRPVLPTRGFLRDRNFWMLTLCVGCLFCCMSATLTHMVPRVSDLGYTVLQAAPILSFGAAAGVFGKVLFGYLVDRVDPRVALYTASGPSSWASWVCCKPRTTRFLHSLRRSSASAWGASCRCTGPLRGRCLGERILARSWGSCARP